MDQNNNQTEKCFEVTNIKTTATFIWINVTRRKWKSLKTKKKYPHFRAMVCCAICWSDVWKQKNPTTTLKQYVREVHQMGYPAAVLYIVTHSKNVSPWWCACLLIPATRCQNERRRVCGAAWRCAYCTCKCQRVAVQANKLWAKIWLSACYNFFKALRPQPKTHWRDMIRCGD